MSVALSIDLETRPPIDEIIALYRASGLQRPVDELARMAALYAGSNRVLAAYLGARLVGICRALSDGHYVCYVADLAVHPDYQRQGIARALLGRLAEQEGDAVSLILLSSQMAEAVYPRLGFSRVDNAYLRRRRR